MSTHAHALRPARAVIRPAVRVQRRSAGSIPVLRGRGVNLTSVPTFGIGVLQRCGGGPEPCPCHDEETSHVQRHGLEHGDAAPDGVPHEVHDVLSTSGTPLPEPVRAAMARRFAAVDGIGPASAPAQRKSPISEPGDASEREADTVARQVNTPQSPARQAKDARAGTDFRDVRVHNDACAAAAARAVNASAFTVGSHIVFASGAYVPSSASGRTLLAHELTHVVQQSRTPSTFTAVARQACGHDGRGTGCYADPALGKVKLIDPSGAAQVHEISNLVVDAMQRRFGGTWLKQVQTPPAPSKGGTERGFVDGMKVSAGSTLDMQIIEVKARELTYGGCIRATSETLDYRDQITGLKQDLVAVSAGLAAAGGLRIPRGQKASPAQVQLLASVGATKDNSNRRAAWSLYNSIQNGLNRTFDKPFSDMTAVLNTDGDPSHTYEAAGPWTITCRGKKPKPGVAYLVYQVNGKGGVSYGCDKQCFTTDEERKQDEARRAADKNRSRGKSRLSQEGDEQQDQPGAPGQPPGKAPVKTPGQPSADDKQLPGQPGSQPVSDPMLIPEVVAATIALHVAYKHAATQAERAALEAAYKKAMVSLAEKGAAETAKRLAINGVKLGSKALEDIITKDAEKVLEKDLEKLGERELRQLATKEAEQIAGVAAKQLAKKTAAKVFAKAIPFLGILLLAKDALAMADQVSKGATIKIGLSGSDVDLSGNTDVKANKGTPQQTSGSSTKLTDTKIDIETSGVPDISGASEIEAKNVTITGATHGDGTPVTVNFKTKLQNSTITITHSGVLRGGKVALTGDVAIKDSQIEIDLPPEATSKSPTPGNPIVIQGRKLKITKSGGTGSGVGGDKSGGTTPPTTPKPVPAKEPPPSKAIASLNDATQAKIKAAGPGASELIDALMIPSTGTGVKLDDAAVNAVLDVLVRTKPTQAEYEKLRTKIGGPAKSLDELVSRLEKNIDAMRAPATTKTPSSAPGGTSTTPTDPKKAGPAHKIDPNAEKFKKLRPGGLGMSFKTLPQHKVGTKLVDQPAYGRLRNGTPWEATVTIKVTALSGNKGMVLIVKSSDLLTEKGVVPSGLVGQTFDVTWIDPGPQKK
jgi:hypothetical protein